MRGANGRHVWQLCLVALATGFLAIPAHAAPQHVVSTFLCTDEYVFRLVPRRNIVALSYLAGDHDPVVSTIADDVAGIPQLHPSAEEFLWRKADLVVMYAGTNPKLRAQLDKAGTKVLDVPWANSLADIRKITLMVGEKLGAPDRAKEMLAAMDRDIAAARAAAAKPPVRTLIYEPNGYSAVGGITDAFMTMAGLINVAPQMNPTRLGQVPVEAVVAHPPELLIVNGEHKRTPSRADLVLRHPALRLLEGKTFVAGGNLTPLLCPGPWSARAALEFARLGNAARHALARRQARN